MAEDFLTLPAYIWKGLFQLETYVKLNALVSRIRTIITAPLIKEAYFQEIIDTESLNIKYME